MNVNRRRRNATVNRLPTDLPPPVRPTRAGPYNWHVNTPVAGCEGYYASVFYAHFAAARLDVATEDASSRGRLDMAVRAAGRVYLFEFKMVDRTPDGKAVAQLRARGYADKYRHLGAPIHLVGVEFSRETRNVAAFTVEPA